MDHIRVRQTFLDFFAGKGHRIVRSSSLIPHGDPTLMFTNAGMNQFKNVFLGLETRDYCRAAGSQKCLRVAGKHNDFEQVGRTARHHTFFEMLGNFSFGDYFKREAVEFAWELLTEVYRLAPERLYATVYVEDDEAYRLWEENIGLPPERIFRLGKKDNYWAMGETGPNGPCSELHYDLRPPAGRLRTNEEVERGDDDTFVELWNLVFMQFNTGDDGAVEPLPKPSIDTGAGLERIAAALQGVISNYDTDLFTPLIGRVAELAGIDYGTDAEASVSARVIADHLRAMTFLVADGALPSNEGRGYVLRRIIRRAIRHGRLIGLTDPFLYRQCGLVADIMRQTYPELIESRAYVANVVQSEEQRFGRAFENSYRFFYDEGVAPAREQGGKTIPGEVVFKAYDTYGMPLDLALEIASEHGMTVDRARFNELLAGQRRQARAAWKGSGEAKADPLFLRLLEQHGPTQFTGYDRDADDAEVLAIVPRPAGEPAPNAVGGCLESLAEGRSGYVVLDRTPFYGESGGQVGDTGRLTAPGLEAEVLNTKKVEGLHIHEVRVMSGELETGATVRAEIDAERRDDIRRNHTVTHILHWALRDILGGHVKQAGSLVTPERVRFDFTHFSALSPAELELVERAVNRRIRENALVRSETKALEQALDEGATALFGEKYGEEVRIIKTGGYSAELCGGTHASATGEIGLFYLLAESSVAAGVRRIEGLTGRAAVRRFQADRELIVGASAALRTAPDNLPESVERLAREQKALRKEVEALNVKLAGLGGGGDAGAESAGPAFDTTEFGRYKIATKLTSGLSPGALRNLADEMRGKIKSGVVLIADAGEGKSTIVLAATKDVPARFDCGELIRDIAALVGGGGGGGPHLAQAGGKEPEKLPEVLRRGRRIIEERLRE